MELFNKVLPKWPALIVVGKKVTLDQAKEIIIRTDSLSFTTNDHEFGVQLLETTYGVKANEQMYHASLWDFFKDDEGNTDWNKAQEIQEKVYQKIRKIPLQYLYNSRIVSSWVGGPKGWCDWNGNINCNNYNIGKYPSVEDVYNEWVLIAEAFPFLELKCQLLSAESCEDNLTPVVEYYIKNGKVTMFEPEFILSFPNTDMESVIANIFKPNGERGCTIKQYTDALNFVKNKFKS